MSRKSARLLSKSKLRSEDSEVQSNKRQKIEINQRVASFSGSQQFRIETKRLPISHMHAVMSSRIVPSNNQSGRAPEEAIVVTSDENSNSLICNEYLPLPRPSCSGDSAPRMKQETEDEEDEIVDIITTSPTPARELYRFSNHFTDSSFTLHPLLPQLDWADPHEIWDILDHKVERYLRSADMLLKHDRIEPNMRPELLNWLTEVCEMYQLQKETYYLAVDYVDRYLLFTYDQRPCRLQLLGITALFLAAKNEEIYPPKVHDFAYVCDEACTVQNILDLELELVNVLEWLLAPLTPHMWVQIILQVGCVQAHLKEMELSDGASAKTADPVHTCTPSFSHPEEPPIHNYHSPPKRLRAKCWSPQMDQPKRDSALMNLASCALAADGSHGIMPDLDGYLPSQLEVQIGNRSANQITSGISADNDVNGPGEDLSTVCFSAQKGTLNDRPSEEETDTVSNDQSSQDEDIVSNNQPSVEETDTVSNNQPSVEETDTVRNDQSSQDEDIVSNNQPSVEDTDTVSNNQPSVEETDTVSNDQSSQDEDIVSNNQPSVEETDTAEEASSVDLATVEIGAVSLSSEEMGSDSQCLEEAGGDSLATDSERVIYVCTEVCTNPTDVIGGGHSAEWSTVSIDVCDEQEEGHCCGGAHQHVAGDTECDNDGPNIGEGDGHQGEESSGEDSFDDVLEDLCSCDDKQSLDFTYPMYSVFNYLQACRLLDSAILDKYSFRFSYKTMAASAVYLVTKMNICQTSGLVWSEVEECIQWMTVHLNIINKHDPSPTYFRKFNGVPERESHLIQWNIIKKETWEEALEETEKLYNTPQSNFDLLIQAAEVDQQQHDAVHPASIITPPQTCKKSKRK